jgi:hypothetical protein
VRKTTGEKIKHHKLRGEWAELRFMAMAAEHGLRRAMTLRWNMRGSFGGCKWKSTMFVDRGGYSCTVRGCRGPYEGDPFDFLAAYLIPEDLWYIIPAEKIRGQGSIALHPRLKTSKYGEYKEAWHLLREGRVESKACADTAFSLGT